MIRFTAHCARDHDRVDFTDPAAFEAHMTAEHGASKPRAGGPAFVGHGSAPGWSSGRPQWPHPWNAPKAPETADGLAAVLVAHAEHVADVGTTGAPAEGLWRWDREGADTVPIDALPRNVRPILEGAIARGEAWLVKIDGPGINVQAGRGRAFGETDAPTVGLRLDVVAGKVRKVQTVDPRRPNAPTGWWDATVTDARQLFPGPGEAVVPAA